MLAAASLAALRDAAFGDADVVVVDVGDAADGRSTMPSRPATARASCVLADAGDERVGEWLIDGCSVLPQGRVDRRRSPARCRPRAPASSRRRRRSPPRRCASSASASSRAAARAPRLLTPRERQVLVEMSHGLGNREIGGALGISAHTAKFHVAQIIAKLDAQSRAHAVAKALRAGLVDA